MLWTGGGQEADTPFFLDYMDRQMPVANQQTDGWTKPLLIGKKKSNFVI